MRRSGSTPNDAESHNNLGNALKAHGKLEEAVAEYREAVRIKPDYVEPHYNLGLVLNAQGKPEEAVAEFRAARDSAPPGSELRKRIERKLSATDR